MDIENPVGGSPKDPYEEYRQQKEREARQEASSKKAFYPFIQILLWMRGILDSLTKTPVPKPTDSLDALKQLKKSFDTLKKADCSQNIDFSNALSICWNNILIISRKHPSHALKAFIKEMQTYPKGQDHTLGYYLTEYAGKNWLPFPYIELLKKIHEEHLATPASSILTRWTRELEQLIATLAD